MELRMELDKTDFPLIFIEPGRFYMHWMPVTKIQLEYFLSAGTVTGLNAEWYDEVLDYNDRISPGAVTAHNYWKVFVTGVKPSEIKTFISWLGQGYRLQGYDLPTHEEWQTAYRYLKETPADKNLVDGIMNAEGINRRAKTLIKNISLSLEEVRSEVRGGRRLADQALLRLGVMEYVYKDERRNTYGGYGQPNSDFFGSTVTPDRGSPERLVDEHDGAKMPHYGFRLIRRGV